MNRLYLLYDAQCPMCTRFREWLVRQPHGTPLDTVPAGSAAARSLFPRLGHGATLREVTVVADSGEVWTGHHAWVMCLWATTGHRDLATRLATPVGLPVAKAMAYAAARVRSALSSGVDRTAVGGGYPDDCDGACQPV